MKSLKLSNHLLSFLVLSLTLGLAPFYPEPHIWGKIKWVAGGAHGMQVMDWFDLFLHGFPWILLLLSIIQLAMKKLKNYSVKV